MSLSKKEILKPSIFVKKKKKKNTSREEKEELHRKCSKDIMYFQSICKTDMLG